MSKLNLPNLREIYNNRKLIFNLAYNDFRTKYAGSYLGIFWAFVQPIVTILVYWFVFSTLRAGNVREVPFVLWLIAGIVPWFFFQEALNSGTNALIEYSYLVKKVVFNISILPVVKLVSSLFVHVFFIAIVLLIYTIMGFFPGITAIQVLYYSVCMFILVLGIVYTTSSIVVFFRDLSQMISIALQIGIWLTPIMWSFEDMNLNPLLQYVFKLNPMYYIVQGYRDALINQLWFWQHPVLTIYFWGFTIAVFTLGIHVFGKLRVHFADIL